MRLMSSKIKGVDLKDKSLECRICINRMQLRRVLFTDTWRTLLLWVLPLMHIWLHTFKKMHGASLCRQMLKMDGPGRFRAYWDGPSWWLRREGGRSIVSPLRTGRRKVISVMKWKGDVFVVQNCEVSIIIYWASFDG